MTYLVVKSPIGPLTLFSNGDAIVALEFGQAADTMPPEGPPPLLKEAQRQLAAYFVGSLERFDLPVAPAGTSFQKSVWHLMRDISYGDTLSYGGLARILKSSARAVGGACGKNPIAIIIPCHRVIAAGNRIGGYSGGGGLDTKRTLLRLEGMSLFT